MSVTWFGFGEASSHGGPRSEGHPGGGRCVRSSGWAAWLGSNDNTELCVRDPAGPDWPSHTSAAPHNLHEQRETHDTQTDGSDMML